MEIAKHNKGTTMRTVAQGFTIILFAVASAQAGPPDAIALLQEGNLCWQAGPPIFEPAQRPADPCFSVKDPTIVFHNGRWHLFVTVRSKVRSHQIEYASFADWKDANSAPRTLLTICPGYFCAPQVFYFRPKRQWMMIFQTGDPSRKVSLQPAIASSPDLTDPSKWSGPTLLFDKHPESVDRWIDFWVICDDQKAHLFFTSNDGRFWRSETSLDAFPGGWRLPEVVLRDDLFEASHTYKIRGRNQYLTIVECQRPNAARYYRAYLADRLEGPWRPTPADLSKPFANLGNVRFAGEKWSESISHGELIRAESDERMEIESEQLRFLFQGVLDKDRAGKPYGQIPWRLGLLTSEPKK